MKYSRTALGLLNAQYRSVLRKCFLINMGLFAITAIATPAKADDVSDWDGLKNAVEAGNNTTLTGNILLSGTETIINANSISPQSINLGEYKIDGNNNSLATNLIQATASDLTIENGEFDNLNRTTDWGSVLHLTSNGNLTIDNVDFNSNKSLTAGVLSVGTAAGSITIKNSTFDGNEAGEIGAVGLFKAGSFENVTFSDNKATDEGGDGIGALFLGSVSTAGIGNSVSGSVFENNTSAGRAGAIGMRDFNQGDNSAATLDIDNTKFIGNTAKTEGGAIDNYFYNDANNDGYVKVTNSEFASNTAASGGAVYNRKGGSIKVGGEDQVAKIYFEDTDFTNNTASALGGALYNEGSATIAANSKDVTFSGNTANDEANDIYNLGTLTLSAAEGKKIVLSGGIDGDASAKGTTNVSGAGSVEIANALKNQNVNNNGNLVLDGADLSGSEIKGDGSVKIVGDSDIKNTTLENQTIEVEEGQEFNLTNVILKETGGKDGTVTNKAGGVLNIKNSTVDVDINNYGTLISDPTTYSGTVTNTGSASFKNDTFTGTAELANSGNVDLLNSVTFQNGAKITGNGDLNLVSGTTHFNDTSNTNDVYLASGAKFDGKLIGGSLNTTNNSIDTGLGSVAADLYVDAKLAGTGSVDSFASATGSTVKEINILGNNYGSNGSIVLSFSGATIDSNVQINGANYYTDSAIVGDTLTLSNKLINSSSLHNELGTWGAGNYVSASDTYDETTNSYNNVTGHQTVGAAIAALDSGLGAKIAADGNFIKASSTNSVNANISALDTAIGNMSGFASQNYATSTTSVAANLTALDTQVKTVDNKFTDGSVDAKFNSVTTTGGATVGGNLNVAGTSNLKDTNVGGDLNVTGDTTLADTTVGGTLDVTGLASLDGGINVNDKFTVGTDGAVSAAGGSFTIASDGKTVVGNDFAVTDRFTVEGATGNTNVGGELSVAGNTAIYGNTQLGGNLAVTDKFTVEGATGNTVIGGTLTAGAGTFTVDTSGNTIAAGKMTAKEFANGSATFAVSDDGRVKATSLAFNSDDGVLVNAIDQGAAAITDGDATTTARKETMATTATVAKTVGNLAALENTHGVTSVADVASAINSLATNVETATGGTFTNNVWNGKVTVGTTTDYTYGGNTGYNNVMAAVSNIASNIGTATTAANGNITSSKSVNANLDQLDEAIGDRSNLGSANEAINQGTKTSVAAGMKAVGDAIGDMNFAGSHYVAGNNDLSGAVRSLDSNLYRVESDLRDLRRDFRRGMASMSAMSALVPNPRANGNTSLSIGTGAYDGHTAAAIGGFHYLTDNIMLNAGVAWGNSSDAAYRMGVTFSW